jgi:hypothetical protein
MQPGIALVVSWTLPLPSSHVSNCWEVVNVQDVVDYQWPQIELAYDNSVVWQGTFVGYAPAWSGAVTFGPAA